MKLVLLGSVSAVVVAICVVTAELAAQGGGGISAADRAAAMKVPTPKRANGVIDFTGIWVATQRRDAQVPAAFDAKTGNYDAVLANRTNRPQDFERDAGIRMRIFPREGRPWYKPRFWERVQFNDINGHSKAAPDPDFQCLPEGVPRMGLPQEILQTDRHMVFLYPLHQRRVFIDGRKHPPEEQWLGTWFGHSIGTWEGDTLVVSTVDFNGLEWLGWPGWFTSPNKSVVERIRRQGNLLTWEAEVTDPTVFLRPWKTGPQARLLNTDPEAEIEEPLPCVEKDLSNMVTRERG